MDVLDEWGEQMSDLIRREDAIKAVRCNAVDIDADPYPHDCVCDLLEAIPTIEPKRGEWEEKETFYNGDEKPTIEEWQSARCSACGKYHTTPYMYYFDNYDFCPHCGADMRGEDDE